MKSLAKVGDGALKLDTMTMEVDPPAEWTQIFNEVWRQERDYFFEASMNGVNWEQQREKYSQLLPYVADRLSLTYSRRNDWRAFQLPYLRGWRRLSRHRRSQCWISGRRLCR